MNPRTTIIAAIVLAALAVYIYKYEREPVEPDADSEREEVFEIEADDIREIEIRRSEGENLKLEKDGEDWHILEPVNAAADASEVGTLARNIANLERERVVAEGEEVKLSDFGLDKPEIEILFKAEEEEKSTGFAIGGETPTGTNRYATLVGGDGVFVVSSYLKSNFDKKPWDLRDKKVLHFETDDVERIMLRNPEGELVLAKASEDRWNVTTPGFCRADRYKASSLVSRFETAKMEEIIAESEDDLDAYGLSRPDYEAEIQLEGGKSVKLLVGEKKDNRYYARNPDRSLVYLVGSSLVDDLTKDASEFRSKRLFEYATYQVNKFQLSPADEPARIFEKTVRGDDEDDQWVQTAPDTRDLDRTKVEDLLYKMNGTDAEGFVDSPPDIASLGLDEPAFNITVWSKEGEIVEELAVAKTEGEWVYARRKGDEPALKITAEAWEAIEKLMSFEDEPEEEGTGEEKKE
jgi:hypothetical protein